MNLSLNSLTNNSPGEGDIGYSLRTGTIAYGTSDNFIIPPYLYLLYS